MRSRCQHLLGREGGKKKEHFAAATFHALLTSRLSPLEEMRERGGKRAKRESRQKEEEVALPSSQTARTKEDEGGGFVSSS